MSPMLIHLQIFSCLGRHPHRNISSDGIKANQWSGLQKFISEDIILSSFRGQLWETVVEADLGLLRHDIA